MNGSDISAGGSGGRDHRHSRRVTRRLAALGAALVLALGGGAAAVGCGDDENEGPVEEAGEAVGEGAEEAGEGVGEGIEEGAEGVKEGAEAVDESLGDENPEDK